ncbi:DUF3179 domain-containing protein [Neiella marina]|uniref:DUF3179 domain-containing protein n=1 Tax=Neiella holothuriorum TaxID=2870530 RepID=A0ABS7EJ23_9GAMM|nr:DUF3179 domain-containing (seleno)protein [Neiella holothuriorum]MBW8192215.1 DUF3179 domain-containing protein [Neiella holothuriorum]
MSNTSKKPLVWFSLVAAVTATFSIFCAVLMTEPGQSLNLPREWIVTYYQYRWWFIGLNIGLMGYLWYLHSKYQIWNKLKMGLATGGVATTIIAANFMLAAFFPSLQHNAEYVSIAEANDILQDEDIVYAVEINGDVRAFPRKHLEIPHIAGDNIGGKDVAITFCALSNLPVVIEQDIGHGESDLGILIQTNNNLVMVDRSSGDLIQQMTMESEFTDTNIVKHANTMMSWHDFKNVYPEGRVFLYAFERNMDKFLTKVFEGPMAKQFSSDHGAIFPTLDMADTRVEHKEQVWGYTSNNNQLAFTQRFAQANPIYKFEVDGRNMVMVYDQQSDILNVFDTVKNGQQIEFEEIDVFGNTDQGRLTQVPMHNGVFWMVWAHWFPNTEVMS